jgi:hypothetical protein
LGRRWNSPGSPELKLVVLHENLVFVLQDLVVVLQELMLKLLKRGRREREGGDS